MNSNNIINPELFNKMFKERNLRIALTTQSHLYFFNFYFPEYVTYATAPFQKEIFMLTEDASISNLCIVSFRASGKSSIITTSYPLWSILGVQKKKFVLILTQTKVQAKQSMTNLKRELENNPLLKNDLGPFEPEDDEWGASSLVFKDIDARITVASSEQSIRGLRHRSYRPDLIICDDIEDLASVKTRESRDKTYQWLNSEVKPLRDKNTRLIVIGNLLHEDSLLMRLKRDIEDHKLDGVFREYPLIKDGKILWTGKYPTDADIEKEKRQIGNEHAWQREFMLKILPTDDQVIYKEWIRHYDVMPDKKYLQEIRIGVDLAISQSNTADYTSMVIGYIFHESGSSKRTIYVDQLVINKRLNFPETVAVCEDLHNTLKSTMRPNFYIEAVAYQRALPQLLKEKHLSVKCFKTGGQDKRSRLSIASQLIKTGEVLFPTKGCEQLIDQLVNFGTERFDDLADAFSVLILSIIDTPPFNPQIYWISIPNRPNNDLVMRRLFGGY